MEDKIKKQKNNRGKNTPVTYIVRCLVIIMLIVSGIFIVKSVQTKMLPNKYIFAVGVMIILFGAIAWATSRKKGVAIIMSIISILLIAGISYGTLAVVRLDRTLNKISTDSRLEIVQMAVVVPVSDEAVTVSDVAGYLIGYNESDNASGDMMIELSKNLSKEAEYTGYPNVIFLADSLLNGDEQAIILNSAYVEIISEVEGYEDFSDRVKILDTIPVETVADYDMEDTDIEEKEPYKLSSDEDTFTIYISGIDTYGSVNTRSRSDVNILAVVNTKTGNIQLINTPRDYYVPLPISNGARDKLTHAGIYGVEVSEGTLEILYDVEIDYYVRMNFSSFERIIDTLGGIDVYSEYDFTVGNYHYNVGNNHLSGDAALAFSRERHSFLTGDVQRGKNQMEVIKAIINKMTTKEFLYKYDDVLEELSDCFQTDMPPETMYSLVNYQLDNNISWNVNSYTVTGFDSHDTTYSMPGFIAYVMVPDDKAVEEAKSLIEKALTK